MTEAERCRALAEADLAEAAATNLETVRAKHMQSASVWLARAEMCERTGLKTVREEETV
jgi:hypothetical protein